MALRESAASATAISHHSAILLRAIATRAAELGNPALGEELTRSAEAAERARDDWQLAVQSWNEFAAEGSPELSPIAVETADLAQWTKHLAYANPSWTLKDGPTRPVRPPESLAPTLDEVREVVAVSHDAAHTLSRLAFTSDRQIRQAAEAGRFYVPNRVPADGLDSYRPFMKAQAWRLDGLLEIYKNVRKASNGLADSIARNATALDAPSVVIASATAARRAGVADRRPEVSDSQSGIGGISRDGEMPGHFEMLLSYLSQTDPEALTRAAEIDRLGEQLLTDTTRIAEQADLTADIDKWTKALGIRERIHGRQVGGPQLKARGRERTASMEPEAEL